MKRINHSIIFLATPLSTEGCLYHFGIYPDSADCSTTYVKCAHGIPYPQHCEVIDNSNEIIPIYIKFNHFAAWTSL